MGDVFVSREDSIIMIMNLCICLTGFTALSIDVCVMVMSMFAPSVFIKSPWSDSCIS